MILSLKALNKHIQNFHLKMETLASAIKLMTPKCFMATVDLKDAYYTVPTKLVRWPTTVTSKPNVHSKLQSAHIKFKSLTSNSNRSHQIQIAHIKFKSLTANSNYSQQITNRSQQIQIAHSKFKSFTAN